MFNKGVLQNDENDCGAAALATVLKIYKKMCLYMKLNKR